MRFVSTQGGRGGKSYGFEEAVLAGWAEDGGMLLPEVMPVVSPDTLQSWARLSYKELCVEILSLFISEAEVSRRDLDAVIETSFACFADSEVVRIRTLPQMEAGGVALHVAELWHGPTLAFKDLGMQVLVNLLKLFLGRRGESLTLLVGTSGDTGSSAIEAVRGCALLDIVVLFPVGGRISPTQERQMTSVAAVEPNVHCIGVEGGSDDLDVPMEDIFQDIHFKRHHRVGSINSVNIARVLVQVVHYFYSVLRLGPSSSCSRELKVAFSIPTGAAGHITAGVMAKAMGLPIAALCAATNANDVLHRVLGGGLPAAAAGERAEAQGQEALEALDLSVADTPLHVTISPSMDIQIPYNIERMLYLVSGGDHAAVAACMRAFKAEGRLRLSGGWRQALVAAGLTSASVTDEIVRRTICSVWQRSGYIIDPHTAVGVAAAIPTSGAAAAALVVPHAPDARSARRAAGVARWATPTDVVCMACAHPAKFMETVASALGQTERRAEASVRAAEGCHRHVDRVLKLWRGGLAEKGPAAGSGLCHVLLADTRAIPAGQGGWSDQVRRIIAGITEARRGGGGSPECSW